MTMLSWIPVFNLLVLILGWVYIIMRVNLALNSLTAGVAEITRTVGLHGERIAAIESVCEVMCRYPQERRRETEKG
jgi:hypothetical protein